MSGPAPRHSGAAVGGVCAISYDSALKSVSQARATGDREGPGGWRERHYDEYTRTTKEFDCLEIVPRARAGQARAKCGAAKAEVLSMVTVWCSKLDEDNKHLRRKLRFTVAHINNGDPMANMHSTGLDTETPRLLAQLQTLIPETCRRS